MRLSIIIVNYNVKHFIEQCLYSVFKALHNIDAEVFVVDNNSVDGSCKLIREKFPQVRLIENKQNVGFSKANNQAISISAGEYVLLLNPDTVVQEDTFEKCINFMEMHPEAAALGIKMIDGKGNFLPESKRSLPTPNVAFYRIFGLSLVFPKSRTFGKYHLSYLDNNKNHEVEILAGAFMFMRRKALNTTGLLDETFFMYGEDIDLSYRFIKAGYKNYYFADSTIIHYKGESTKKGSLNYVLMFYNAMLIFARKHFTSSNVRLYSFIINLAIFLRASLSVIKQFVKRIALPATDFILIYAGFNFLVNWWEDVKHGVEFSYPENVIMFALPAYSAVILICLFITNAYERPVKLPSILKGVYLGGVVILIAYALLPLEYRFSRAVILLGILYASIILVIVRFILQLIGFKAFMFGDFQKKRIVIVGEEDECARVIKLLNQTQINPQIIGQVRLNSSQSNNSIGKIYQLDDIVYIYKVEELIFCARDLNTHDIIDLMMKLSDYDLEYKIAPPESLSVIGSNSIHTAGDLYLIHLNSISKTYNKRLKRNIDIIFSVLFAVLFPILLPFQKKTDSYFKNIFNVLFGKKTWVGYYTHEHALKLQSNTLNATQNENINITDLPVIRNGIFSPINGLKRTEISTNLKEQLNYLYAKDYKYSNDIGIILKNIFCLGY